MASNTMEDRRVNVRVFFALKTLALANSSQSINLNEICQQVLEATYMGQPIDNLELAVQKSLTQLCKLGLVQKDQNKENNYLLRHNILPYVDTDTPDIIYDDVYLPDLPSSDSESQESDLDPTNNDDVDEDEELAIDQIEDDDSDDSNSDNGDDENKKELCITDLRSEGIEETQNVEDKCVSPPDVTVSLPQESMSLPDLSASITDEYMPREVLSLPYVGVSAKSDAPISKKQTSVQIEIVSLPHKSLSVSDVEVVPTKSSKSSKTSDIQTKKSASVPTVKNLESKKETKLNSFNFLTF